MTIPTVSYLDSSGQLSDNCTHQIPDEVLIRGLEVMLLTQEVDARMLTLQRQGNISFAMSSRGEECCAVASAAALLPQDWMYPQYREVGALFWRSYSLEDFVHHMFCNAKDVTLGRQMPNHFGSRDLNVVTVSSSLASKIPHAAGCAYSMKLKGEDAVAISYFGEGAASEGDFHAGINFGAVRKVPCIYFCRNNHYAISTPTADQYTSDGIAGRAISYGIETHRIDGNDFFATHEAVSLARKACLEGKGPVFIEAMTYRLGAHSTSDDPSLYRDEKEVAKWKKKDPIIRLRKYLEGRGLWDSDHEKELLKRVKATLDTAIREARNTPPPALETLIKDVYANVPEKLEEQLRNVMPEEEPHYV